MIRRILRRLRGGVPLSPEMALVKQASAHPRHTPVSFSYKEFNLKATDFLSVAWQIQEVFGEERLKFPALSEEPVVIDCGANLGITVLYYKKLYPRARVLCYEPDPTVFKCLLQNLQGNGISHVECEEKVVWIHDKGVSFGMDGADGGSVLRGEKAVILPSVRLQSVLQRYERVDLLKIDIEGAETAVLRDCADQLQKVRFLYVEYHSLKGQEQELDELLRLLRSQGFRYYIHRTGAYHRRPFEKIEDGPMDMLLDIHAIRA